MQWITREYVRVGRMGIGWLVRTYIDPQAEFLFVPGNQVLSEAERLGATAFHVPTSGGPILVRSDGGTVPLNG